MKRVSLQPAYVLHRRSYRETSYLVDLYTPGEGRVSVVARSANKLRTGWQGLLQPFVPLVCSYSGKGELMTLSHVEASGTPLRLQGECLFAGLYLNELLMCLLQKGDAHEGQYRAYESALNALNGGVLEQKILRSFEKYLLEEMGYGLLPKSSPALHQMISPDQYYRFIPDQGLTPDAYNYGAVESLPATVFLGKNLLAIAKEEWHDEDCLRDAKRLTRCILAPLLGARPLYSRQLFIQLDDGKKSE